MKHLGFKQVDSGKASKHIKLAKKAVRLWIIAASEKIAELRLHDVKESNVWRKLYEDQPRSFNE